MVPSTETMNKFNDCWSVKEISHIVRIQLKRVATDFAGYADRKTILSDQDYLISIFNCLIFPDVQQPSEEDHRIRDTKYALEALEKDFLNKIIEFEETYGVTFSGIETNISNEPAWEREKLKHTNYLILYSDLS
jgi:hypothetical protein